MPINPYAPGAGTDPPVLAGRDSQLALIEAAANRAEGGLDVTPLVLTGLRGMGKTVLLHQARLRLDNRGWATGYLEGRRSLDTDEATRLLVAEAESHLSAGRRLVRSSRKILRSISGFTVPTGPAGAAGVLRTASAQDVADQSLASVLRPLGRAAQEEGLGFALFFDELQTLRRRDVAILIRSISLLRGLPVVFVGAGLPYLPAELASASTYAERFDYTVIDWLPPDDVRQALVGPAIDSGHNWDEGGYRRLYELSHGYPYFVQLYASEAWERAEHAGSSDITEAEVLAAEPRVQSRVDVGLYAARYDRATTAEQKYLQAMARVWRRQPRGGGEQVPAHRALEDFAGSVERVRSGEVARELEQALTAVGPIRDRLIRKGILHSPQHGVIAFSVPGFADYVLRRAELEET
jgi:hypothetical protein